MGPFYIELKSYLASTIVMSDIYEIFNIYTIVLEIRFYKEIQFNWSNCRFLDHK